MKSLDEYLQGLYTAMLSNIAELYPTLYRDCERDSLRLLSLIKSRGLPYLMIDLPDAGKHFDMCLSKQLLSPFAKPGFRPFKRGSPVPRLFKGLVLRVFDESGLLRVNPDIQCISFLRQLFNAAKKCKVPCDDSKTWEHVHEFFKVDQEVRLPSLSWDEDEFNANASTDLHLGDHSFVGIEPDNCLFDDYQDPLASCGWDVLDAVQRTADCVVATLGRFNPSDWRAKHGPGSVADQRGTQFKYHFPSWPAKLARVFPMCEFGFANFGTWAAFVTGRDSERLFRPHEYPSRLIAVPKTLKGPRLIASEPVSHQWCQQTILDFLTGRLAYTPISRSIHFRDQTENQEFARRASHTQSHVTIDLSSASDRLSCWVVERIFRRNPALLDALQSSRTRWVANTIDKKSPQFHKLRKFACMGSACTFPVQSYVFTILAIGSILYVRKLQPSISNIRRISQEVRVFGDDIIVPMDCWDELREVLGSLQLKVNPLKTYGEGNFRESCGLDAYDGHDVTPTYSITYPDVSRPESIMSCVDTHNNFFKRGWERVAAYIRSTVDSYRLPIMSVPIGSGCFGWYSYVLDANERLKRRFNSFLQRTEYRCAMLRSSAPRLPVEDDATVLQYFTEGPKKPIHPIFGVIGHQLGVQTRSKNKLVLGWVNPT